jgi:uncharacterized protein
MDKLFLDANVLFSAAYREAAGIAKLWTLKKVKLLSSRYALEEAQRNLTQPDQQARLTQLISQTAIQAEYDELLIPQGVELRKKDRPILAAAIGSEADYLITGDQRDFGCFYGKKIATVMILPPSDYLHNYYKK